MKALITSLLLFICFIANGQTKPLLSNTWQEALHSKKGNLVVFWYTSTPFIFENEKGELAGVEYEIVEGFKNYLRNAYHVDLNIQWIKSNGFLNVIDDVKNHPSPAFGASAFSIVQDRLKWIDFTPAYLGDVSVLISSSDVPMAKSSEELFTILNNLKAVTIKGTTYEKDLIKLKEEHNINFSFEYIPSSDNVFWALERQQKSFGYIDLPVYLTQFTRNTSLKVKRQNFHAIKKAGYALIYSKGSDWQFPLNEYFVSKPFKGDIQPIIGRYMDPDIYEFLLKVSNTPDEDIELLTKEKEIQSNELRDRAIQIEKDATLRKILMGSLLVIGLSLIAIAWLYYSKHRTHQVLASQKEMIEAQRKNIEQQKIELEKRNNALEDINQEKNHLIKILAHDLRSPLHQISGIAQLMEIDHDKDHTDYINKIQYAIKRLEGMITKILDVDAIETNRINLITEEIEVQPIIRDIVHSYEKTAREKNIVIHSSSQPELKVLADRTYLSEVIENLVTNALKFSSSNKRIEISCHDTNGKAEVHIKDEGPGFTEEDKKFLFQKFKKLSAQPTGGEQSTGLGLSIVKKFMELMNGEVICQSESGKGSTFILRFQKARKN
ncbi:MAG: transporter substrate-binding domain-containing protein [Bacteroidetes bacterium]|nr:transporter substrate-binding domain-containing protein [Bacteroidota bacterium]